MKRMVVDGEYFDVTERADDPGVSEFRWTSGPNENHGFATTSSGAGQTDAELEHAIRNFLSQVDPTTGSLE